MKATLTVRDAIMADAAILAPKLRTADSQEIRAATGEAPYGALVRSIAWSDPCHAIMDSTGSVIALFGVVPDCDQADVGTVWLLGSPAITLHSTAFIRHSKIWVERLHARYATIGNYVDARNDIHIHWLKW